MLLNLPLLLKNAEDILKINIVKDSATISLGASKYQPACLCKNPDQVLFQ